MAAGDKIYLADKKTLDEVNTKVGATTDPSGTATAGSLMGKLNALISSLLNHVSNWTAARAENLDAAISTRESEASASSRFNALITTTATNNNPSATGTLSQKLSKVLDELSAVKASAASNTKRLTAKKVMANIPSKTTVTLVDIQGAGVFYTGYITANNAGCKITITIDGTPHVVSNNIDGTFGRIARYPVMFSIAQTGLFVSPTEFKDSFSVTIESSSTSNITCYLDYSVYE